MAWDDTDEATRVHKFINNGVYAPEDLRPNEFRVLKEYYPDTAHYVRWWLETRAEMIESGDWTENHEPPDTGRRIKRYENGNGLVDPHDPDT